jgi:hypothetical protein
MNNVLDIRVYVIDQRKNVLDINWDNLEHAYGDAGDIPVLLKQIESFPIEGSYDQEPWFSLWSSLSTREISTPLRLQLSLRLLLH